jgi:anti-sigma B factor antagonist
MHFITDQQDDTTIFRLREERLDSRNAGQLKAEFLILAQPDIQSLIVDLSEVRHIDSAGLSALLLAQRQMTVHDGELRLAGVAGEVLSLLEMTQLNRVFRIFNTVKEALAAPPIFRDAWERKAWEEEHAAEGFLTDEPNSVDLRAGALAAGSVGAAALANIIMNTTLDDELELPTLYALGDEEDEDDDDFDDDDFDDDLDDDDDDEVAEEAEDVDEKDKPEGEEIVEPEDLDEDFEDDDWDDEELDDDDDDDY